MTPRDDAPPSALPSYRTESARREHNGLPYFPGTVRRTLSNTPYFTDPGVMLLAQTSIDLAPMQAFLDQFDTDLKFRGYLIDPVWADEGTQLVKTAGQLCYFAFGEKRTLNKDADRYIEHILESKHGSVLEHVSYTFLLYGVSRSFTHELVRHRVGIGFSQVSQRYCGEGTLRFVRRPEYADDPIGEHRFRERIDRATEEYTAETERLMERMRADKAFKKLPLTEQRKSVRQAARALLPNETEAPIVVTGNARIWRHFLQMRGSREAEWEIREVALRICYILQHASQLFADFKEVSIPGTTRLGLEPGYANV